MKIPEDIEKTLPITIDYFEYDLGAWGKARLQRWPLMDSADYKPMIVRWTETYEPNREFTQQIQINGTT